MFLQASEELGFRVRFIKYLTTGTPLESYRGFHFLPLKLLGKFMVMTDDSGSVLPLGEAFCWPRAWAVHIHSWLEAHLLSSLPS